MISREMIISYLTEYSAIEEIFRTYYEQDGKVNSFYDMEKKYAFFMKEGSRFLQRKKELDFETDKNIFINKHIRFSPGEFHDHEFIEMCYISADHSAGNAA